MSIHQIKRSSIYLTIDANPRPIRPLNNKTVSMWTHTIPNCSIVTPQGNKITLRQYREVGENQDFVAWFKNNQDPLWDKLDDKSKFARKDNKRQDFPSRLRHLMPVWSYLDNDVKLVKQGSQLFEEMDKFDDVGGGDITSCDWLVWSKGSSVNVRYESSRQDQKQFVCPIDQQLLQQKVKACMDQAFADLNPFKDLNELAQFINGQTTQDAVSFPHGANVPVQIAQPQQALPPYIQGGQTNVALGSSPLQQPTPVQSQQPMQIMPQQMQPQQMQPAYPTPGYGPQMVNQNPYMQPQVPIQNTQVPPTPYQPMQMPTYQPPRVDVPNAPINSMPTFAPPVQVQQVVQPQVIQPVQSANGNPNDFMIDFGKYSGKTLGWLKDNQSDYLKYLRANKRELTGMIDQVMSAPTQVSVQIQAPAPQSQTPAIPSDESAHKQLVLEINEKIMKIEEFKGRGLQDNMIPFVKGYCNGTTQWSDATTDQLLKMRDAINIKLGVTA